MPHGPRGVELDRGGARRDLNAAPVDDVDDRLRKILRHRGAEAHVGGGETRIDLNHYVVAAVGIAGVLAFSVSARTNEIGIRMCLGADRNQVQRMILSEGGVLLVIGLALGVAGAAFVSRAISGLLFGVAPHDATTFVVVVVMMAAIGVLACWIPALRASRIDPATIMRSS